MTLFAQYPVQMGEIHNYGAFGDPAFGDESLKWERTVRCKPLHPASNLAIPHPVSTTCLISCCADMKRLPGWRPGVLVANGLLVQREHQGFARRWDPHLLCTPFCNPK